jgi:glycosyltransferase involved in cell wall biosynthesis
MESTEKNLRISVSIPTYNQGQYVEQAILSVFNQTVKPDEIIVSNDCSTDHTMEVLEKLKSRVPVLQVINQPVNLGINKNVDACLKAASGAYILRLDSDDFLEPEYIEVLLGLMEKYPEAGYGHANVCEVDQYNHKLKNRTLYRQSAFQKADDALKAAVKGYRVAANIVIFRRKALEQVNFMAGRPNFGEDFHLAANLAAEGWGNVFSPRILSNYRVWVDAGMVRQKRKMTELQGLTSVFEEVITPAFKKRNWNTELVEKSREDIASAQSDCLGWNLYSAAEIEELTIAVLGLSSSAKTKRFIWINKNGYGSYLKRWRSLKNRVKTFLKEKVLAKNVS